jgi:hypothetical protein
MQAQLHLIPTWLADWRMAVNVKIAALLTGGKRKMPNNKKKNGTRCARPRTENVCRHNKMCRSAS